MRIQLWHIDMLGGLRVHRETQSLPGFQSTKVASLLAYLAYYADQPHTREELQALLWPTDALEAVRNRLRVGLSSLRRQLEPPGTPVGSVVLADRTFVLLQQDAFTTDTAQFQNAVKQALQCVKEGFNEGIRNGVTECAKEEEQIERLTRAVELYGGSLLPGFYDEWIISERERLAQSYLQVLRRLTQCLAKARNYERALSYASIVTQVDPLREEAHRDIIRLYMALGQPSAALQQYEALKRNLQEILGAEPSGSTQQLARQIREGLGHAALSQITPHAAKNPIIPLSQFGRLPVYLTRFFGRDQELQVLDRWLSPQVNTEPALFESRLVTLTGLGGNGKTRLAVALAHRLYSLFQGNIRFVPLVELLDANLIPAAIMDVLHLTPLPHKEPLQQIQEVLAQAPTLLILDNFEHLVEQGAPFVESLLANVPTVACLVTSRRPLGISGEREYQVAPLPVPHSDIKYETAETAYREYSTDLPGCPSIQLFVDRAQVAHPGFQLTDRNITAVVTLCRNLEGIPLALELAAARARVLTPEQMLTHLEHRFELLVNRHAEKDARHRSLRATIEWSVRLLPLPLQRLFAQLSIFVGGWSLQAAQSVYRNAWRTKETTKGTTFAESLPETSASWLLDDLERLCGDALITVHEGHKEIRFTMLETLRAFAREQITPDDWEALKARYIQYFVEFAEEAKPKLKSVQQAYWLDRLHEELDNLRAVFEFCLSDSYGTEMGLRLMRALERYWIGRGLVMEGIEWSRRILALPEAQAPTVLRVNALIAAGALYANQDNYEEARLLHQQAIAIAQQVGDRAGEAWALDNLGTLALRQGDFTAAYAFFEQSLTLHRATDDKAGIASVISHLGSVAQNQENYALAKAHYLQSLQLHEQLGDRLHVAVTLNNLGMIAKAEDQNSTAQDYYERSLTLHRELNNLSGIASTVMNLGVLAATQQDYEISRLCFSEALTLARPLGLQRGVALTLGNMARLEEIRGDYQAACSLYKERLAITRDLGNQAMIAQTLVNLGKIYIALNVPEAAYAALEEALTISYATGDQQGITQAKHNLEALSIK